MIIGLLFAISSAHADLNQCEIELDGDSVRPVIRLANHLDEPMDINDVAAEIEWGPLLGRQVRVKQKLRGDRTMTSRQTVMTRSMLDEVYPNLRLQGEAIDQVIDERRSRYERSWVNKALRALGFFKRRVALNDAFYPGEAGILSAATGDEGWQSDVQVGYDHFKKLTARLFLINGTMALDELKAYLIDKADRSDGSSRPLVKIAFLHNHPGRRPVPLSRQDLKTQRKIADIMDAWGDAFDYEITMVALANWKSSRDIAFVRTINRDGEVNPGDVVTPLARPRAIPQRPPATRRRGPRAGY